MAIKTIDTIRRIRDGLYEQTKDLTHEQRRAFFKEKAEETAQKTH